MPARTAKLVPSSLYSIIFALRYNFHTRLLSCLDLLVEARLPAQVSNYTRGLGVAILMEHPIPGAGGRHR
jgi:hypothetical protein